MSTAPKPDAEIPQDGDVLVDEAELKNEALDAIPSALWRSLFSSFAAAFAGVARTIATQRNMKIHVVSAFMVLIVGMALSLDLATRAALIFCAGAVWFAEILNTALEAFVDLHIRQFHRLAMLAKDAAAGGVLVLAGTTVLIFSEVVRAHWEDILIREEQVARSIVFGVPATVSLAIILWGTRKGWRALLPTLSALLLLMPLAWYSVDRLFTACAFGIIILSRYARARFPGSMPRGRPVPPGARRG